VRVLVVGGGGREHALVWAMARSSQCARIFCAPGNAGIEREPKTSLVSKEELDCDKHEDVVEFCNENGVSLVVIGPEAELVAGLADSLRENGIRAFGPSRKAAQLEGSKTFMKDLCDKYGIPTAGYEVFVDPEKAKAYLGRKDEFPVVVKADGLAAGKGVVVAQTMEEATEAVDSMLLGNRFGSAGSSIVIEDFLAGEEASFFVIVDSKGNTQPLHSAQDHKAAYDGDRGPNTGGMGAYSPAPVLTPEMEAEVMESVIEPLVRGLREEGCPFQGVIFAGLMIDDEGAVKVLEFNVRFGDPECEVLMHRLQTDLLDIILSSCDGTLDKFDDDGEGIQWRDDPALVVIMAAEGYPGEYDKGTVIKMIEEEEGGGGAKVFHAGTKEGEEGETLAVGGRVLAVTASGSTVKEAQKKAYEAVDNRIDWPQGFCRRDIGWRAVQREERDE